MCQYIVYVKTLKWYHLIQVTPMLSIVNATLLGGNGDKGQSIGIFNRFKYPKMFNKRTQKNAEATLASMETLGDKLDPPNDGMENIKLDMAVSVTF